MSLEALWYEASPYVYFVTALGATLFSSSNSGLLFSALLLTATFSILRLRRIYRSPENETLRKYSRPRSL